jgi:hypothetical protein
MNELNRGLWGLEVHEQVAYHRDRARRELLGAVREERVPLRRRLRVRRAA